MNRGEMPAVGLTGVDLIAQERMRQVCSEGYTAQHDNEHTHGELAIVAAELAADGLDCDVNNLLGMNDPWGLCQKHRSNRIRQLVIAGALIASEIDRLQRPAVLPGNSERER